MKRKYHSHVGAPSPKKTKPAIGQSTNPTPAHPVLQRLYPQLLTLRHHLLARLPRSSKNRRRKISQLGHAPAAPAADSTCDADIELGELLDTTLVGGALAEIDLEAPVQHGKDRDRDIVTFTQQLSQATPGGTFRPGYFLQREIVNFVIWRLFKQSTVHRPSHLLCHGFQRSGNLHVRKVLDVDPASSIPGLVARHPNSHVQTLKGPLWCRLHALLGQGGDRIMMDLLLECAIFRPIHGSQGNYYQLSGVPISEMKIEQTPKGVLKNGPVNNMANQQPHPLVSENKTPNTIVFVRSRMLYAKAALNAQGGVRFGMRHIHVLNRYPECHDAQQTKHVMRYIFPRQFGLHNVFTSKIDSRETAMPFKDYTLREKDIHQCMRRDLSDKVTGSEQVNKWKNRVPKRLRGEPVTLVALLRTLNQKCPYTELLRHYCPVEGVPLSPKPEWRNNPFQPAANTSKANSTVRNHKNADCSRSRTTEQTCFTDMACPAAHVSAFCRAVLARVIPNKFWGNDSNKREIMYWIDQFVCLRRFESLTLHQVTQKLQITGLSWLWLPGQDETTKLARTDLEKRKEVFFEFVYWVFDSFLIPLIRSNFYVTESNVHRNRLFYFRHDVWQMLTKPFLSTLKRDMFEEVPTEQAAKLLSVRSLGFSKIRLLPKAQGFRTIMNLKRRQQVMRNGTMSLGRSINTVMTPAFNVMTYEKSLQPDRFGCSLFSVNDMFPKLVAFKAWLQERNLSDGPLYFAKVDVQSCFDSIPQSRLVSMVDRLMTRQAYQTGKHVEVSPLGVLQRLDGQHVNPMPLKRYVAHSGAAEDFASFSQLVQDKFVGTKTNTVFVKTNVQHSETKHELMQLLGEHVERNLVKIGKRFYRQKTGIPQGSILSTILCNLFYAELERNVLDFALGDDCLLLRLLDDFLLITVNRQHAERFIRVMHRGHADYGVVVKPSKTLANFEATTDEGYRIPRSASDTRFTYCGVCIDTRTLEVGKKEERLAKADVENSLTIDVSKMPGQTFHRKALNGFKIQLKAMFIDATLNSIPTILANLYQSFYEAAARCLEYKRGLSKVRTMCSSVLISKSYHELVAQKHAAPPQSAESVHAYSMDIAVVEQYLDIINGRQHGGTWFHHVAASLEVS